MADLAYIGFVLAFAVFGAIGGLIAHFARALETVPEDLGLGETLNTLTRDDYQFEKNVIGAEWDDNGYWDGGSPRNLLYYMASGFAMPIIMGVVLWSARYELVAKLCMLLARAGLHPPLCF